MWPTTQASCAHATHTHSLHVVVFFDRSGLPAFLLRKNEKFIIIWSVTIRVWNEPVKMTEKGTMTYIAWSLTLPPTSADAIYAAAGSGWNPSVCPLLLFCSQLHPIFNTHTGRQLTHFTLPILRWPLGWWSHLTVLSQRFSCVLGRSRCVVRMRTPSWQAFDLPLQAPRDQGVKDYSK